MITRLITSINYAEDIDSLRFALATQFDYNIFEQRPHFPGYPIFVFFAKLIYFLTQSVQYTFSIIGAVSTAILINFSRKIANILYFDKNFILIFLIFFNPFFWILSNRYMSDLLGLSVLIISCYYFLKYLHQNERKYIFLAFFILGLSIGIRVSFIPFLFPFIIYYFINNKTDIHYFIFFGFLGVCTWLVPLLIMTDPYKLYNLALHDTSGHFINWGGTFLSSDNSILNRFYKTFESIWADNMGGWWIERSLITILPSISYLYFSYNGFIYMKNNKIKKEHFLILACILTYFIWILFFQNVVYKPRHVIPLIPFIIMFFDWGIQKSIKTYITKFLTILLCLSTILISGTIVYQHKYPGTAINQMKEFVVNYNKSQKLFYSSRLISGFVESHKNKKGYLENYSKSYKNRQLVLKRYSQGATIFSTQKFNSLNLVDEKKFFHNPYLNRLWSRVDLFIYSKPDLSAK